MSDRNTWVDYAKAIGILLVVYGHVVRGVYNAGIPVDESLYLLVDSIIYSFHMPLFFFLSGLFFYNSLDKRGIKRFVGSKIDTIVYPFLIWSIIQGVIEVYLSSYTTGGVTFSEVFSLLWSPRAHFWFLYALFMIFVLASLFFSKVSIRYLLLVFVISALLYLFQNEIPSTPHVNFVTNNLVFFIFGMVVNKWSDLELLSSSKLLPITAVGFLLLQYLFHIRFGLTYNDKGVLSLLVALVAILFVVAISKVLAKLPWKLLLLMGTSSMAIYLMHILAASGGRVLLKNIMGIEIASIHIVVGCLLGVLLPLVAVFIADKIKFPFLLHMPLSRYLFSSGAQQKS